MTVQDYDFLGHGEAATTEYDSGVGSVGMEIFGTGVGESVEEE